MNLIRGDAAQISNKSQFRQRPDNLFGRIHPPWLDPVAVVMLKFVVVLSSDRVTRAVNQKCAVLGNFEWLPRLDSNQE
jgi:hypothetical protein